MYDVDLTLDLCIENKCIAHGTPYFSSVTFSCVFIIVALQEDILQINTSHVPITPGITEIRRITNFGNV